MNCWKRHTFGICISIGLTFFTPSCFAEITTLGDFNNDGNADLVISVPGEEQGTLLNIGAINIMQGTATGLSAAGDSFFRLYTPSDVNISDASAIEGNQLLFTVTRSNGTGSQSVDYTTQEQISLPNHMRALSGDFTAVSGSLNFLDGETSKTISVTTKNDGTNERDNTLEMVLTNATNGANIVDGLAVGTIVNNDPAPNYSISAVDASEGSPLQFTIITDRASEITYTIDYATSNNGALAPEDYTAQSGTLTYGWNNRTKTLSIITLDDNLPEVNEGITVTLSNLSGGAVISIPSATANILNDDILSIPSIPALSESNDTDGSYTISWNIVLGASSYELQQQIAGGFWSNLSSSINSNSYVLSEQADGDYNYRVSACIVSACTGYSNSSQTVLVRNLPTIPTPVTSDNENISMNWNNPVATIDLLSGLKGFTSTVEVLQITLCEPDCTLVP